MDGSSGVFVLTWEDLEGVPRSRELDGEAVAIGRRTDRDIQFDFRDVSREHCRLVRQAGGWIIEDDGSLSGTHVNGEPVVAPRRLVPGDVIRLGEHGLVQLAFRRRAELSDVAPETVSMPTHGEHLAVMLALMQQMSATLDVEDVLGLAVDGALRLTGMPAGFAILQDGRRHVVRSQRGRRRRPSEAGMLAVKRAIRGCSTVVDAGSGCAAVPLRTFEGDRRGADTGVHRAAGALLLESDGPATGVDLRPATLSLVQTTGDLAAVHLAHAMAHERATTDALTGLRNRGWFDQALARQVRRCAHGGVSFALAVADIDRFKAVNDNHGHQAGDAVLAEVAQRMRSALRRRGVACRYGGEEIAVLLPDFEEAEAADLLDEVRRAIARSDIPLPRGGGSLRVTISAGVAAVVPDAAYPVHLLVQAADQALYAAKEGGRNQVRRGTPGQAAASEGA